MRLEIIVPDDTSPELMARVTALAQRLTATPELAETIVLDEDEVIQRMLTPDRLAHIDEALAQVKSGKFFTAEQVEEHFAKKESAWQRQNP